MSIDYATYYLFKDGRFFVNENVHKDVETDEDGNGRFTDLHCSVFSYIFYALSSATYNATEDCHKQAKVPETSKFHYTWNKTLNMIPKATDVDLTVVDRETAEPLAGSTIIYEFDLNGRNRKDSIQTSAAGTCTIKNVPECGCVTLSRVCSYGYVDTINLKMDVLTVLAYPDSAQVKLTPLKQRFSYFVKNKFTKEPVPGATVEIILTSSNGAVLRGKSITNVDGKGLGVYEDAFVLANIELKASKRQYKDGTLDKKYTVEQFVALPESGRTVYIEPEPYMEQFQNVDSITGVPVSGVKNDIQIKSISGKDESLNEISNRNGIFYVKAMKGDRVEIHSDLLPYYIPKETIIKSFSDGEFIKMQPKITDLTFRTIDGETGELLPQCTLSFSSSISSINSPTSSGNGTFTIKNLYVGEIISIVASKNDYTTNSNKICNVEVLELMSASQGRRDIPLLLQLPPCNEGGDDVDLSDRIRAIKSYNMGVKSGRFLFDWETYSIPDRIQVYNCREDEIPQNSPIFDTGMTATSVQQHEWITFSNGSVITVVGTTSSQDISSWKYFIHCP